MAKAKNGSGTPGNTAADVGYEAQLWQMADPLRGSMDAAEYKHVCLGLLFLKYISDAFEERHAYLARAVDDPKDEYYLPPSTRNRSEAVTRLLEDPDEYRAQSIFWVPPEAIPSEEGVTSTAKVGLTQAVKRDAIFEDVVRGGNGGQEGAGLVQVASLP